jgi:hypothetical protein
MVNYKPCPQCESVDIAAHRPFVHFTVAECTRCRYRTPECLDEADAVDMWNHIGDVIRYQRWLETRPRPGTRIHCMYD